MGVLSMIAVGEAPVLRLVKSSAARKADAELRLALYHDHQSEDLLHELKRRWKSADDFPLFHVNIVRKVVDRRASVYRTKPFRTFSGLDQARGEALYAAMNVDARLKHASRMTKLCKTCALKVGWAGAGPTLSLVTPNVLDVETGELPEDLTLAVVTRPGARETETTYDVWSASTFHRLDYRGRRLPSLTNSDGVNPYGMLPFVPVWDRAPEDDFFLVGGDDLVLAQRAVNVALVNLWRNLEFQSHGQAWMSGVTPSPDQRMLSSPASVVFLPENGKFGFASPDAPVEDVLRAIEHLMKWSAIANDLPPTAFETDPKEESGVARALASRDLLEARADDVELWRGYEARLFEVVKTVVNTHAPGTIPEGATLSVDFGDPDDGVDEASRLAGYQARIDLGIWSPVDALMADNPDLRDRAAALAILQERRAEREVLGASFAGPSFTFQEATR